MRRFAEGLQRQGATLVRIDPRESEGPNGTIRVAMGAREVLDTLEEVRSGRASKAQRTVQTGVFLHATSSSPSARHRSGTL